MALALVPVSLSGGRKASVDVRVVVIALTVPLGLAMVVLHTIYVYLKRQESIKEQVRRELRPMTEVKRAPSFVQSSSSCTTQPLLALASGLINARHLTLRHWRFGSSWRGGMGWACCVAVMQ